MRIDSPLMTNAIVTGSFSGSFTGAFDGDITADSVAYANITGKPTLVSSSAQVVALVEAGTDSNTFTDADHTKLNGIEASATADQTDAEIRTAVENATDSNVFTDADHTKLNGIEASADVTDATNVTAAGALMDSELAEIATVKALTAAGISGSLSAAAIVALGANIISGSASDVRTFLNVEDGATGDQSNAEIRTAVEAATDSNVFTDADHTKLNGIEASADVTDTANVTAAGALMDSEVTNLAEVKAFDSSDYATAAQGAKADSAQQPPSEGAFEDGDKTKLDGIEASADVTDTTNVTAAGALMDSELTNLAAVKAINQGLATGNDVQFNDLTLAGDLTVNGTTVSINATNLDVTDKLISINKGGADAASANGGGLFISGANESLTWDNGNSRFSFSDDLHAAGNITLTGTVDGRDVATDGTKLDGIEASADVTDTTNVTAAGALMDSECTSLADVKALNQSVVSGASPTFGTANMTDATNKRFMTDAQETKLDSVETNADVTDATNVKANLPSGVISGSAQITGVVITADSTNTSRRMVFTESDDATDTNAQLFKDSAANFFYNPSTNTLSVVNIAASGNVDGRDVSADGSKLDGIEASADVTDATNVTAAGALMDSELTDLAAVKAINQGLTTTSDVRFDSIGIGTAAPGTSGVLRATNDIVAFYSSDERLKDNIEEIPNALSRIEDIRGVQFDWNDKQSVYEGHDIGVIAQEIEKVAPSLVTERDNGYKAVKYEKLTAILIQAVKELSAKVKQLENK